MQQHRWSGRSNRVQRDRRQINPEGGKRTFAAVAPNGRFRHSGSDFSEIRRWMLPSLVALRREPYKTSSNFNSGQSAPWMSKKVTQAAMQAIKCYMITVGELIKQPEDTVHIELLGESKRP